ncbi:MAG: biotin--[acetyl-CoA-carboxylase] ligase [Desulfobacteraceae bacterium]|nr:MAG: biotin--[acetyl-CoA-carboxylase] ligase [Desulfobacteraceae bacterium]
MPNAPSDPIDPEELKSALADSLFGKNVLYYPSLESTNTLLKSLASQGAPDGTLLLADEQTGGRGRMGRSWLSRPGANLLFSLLLRPQIEPEQVFALTMILAISAAEVLRARASIPAKIKWPNDLYAGTKKLAGILTEFGVKGKMVDYVILGIGLNVHWHPANQEETRGPATSVRMETGEDFPRAGLLVAILKEFEKSYRKYMNGEIDLFFSKWNELSLILGRNVVVEAIGDTLRGRAVQIDRSGALILEEENGGIKRVLCGDVSLKLEENH